MAVTVVDGMRAMELGTVGEMRERLNGLVLAGLKKATAGLLPEYEAEPFERPGERLVVVNDHVQRVGIVEVTSTTLTTFGDVPWSFAQAENEGDRSIEEWRDGHRAFWRRDRRDTGVPPLLHAHRRALIRPYRANSPRRGGRRSSNGGLDRRCDDTRKGVVSSGGPLHPRRITSQSRRPRLVTATAAPGRSSRMLRLDQTLGLLGDPRR